MISINVIGEMVSGSYGNTPYSRRYEKDIYEQMVKLADQAEQAATVEEYNKILAEFSLLTAEDLRSRHHIADIAGDIYISKDAAGRYFMELTDGYLLDTPMPESLVDRILDSFDTGTDTAPLAKLWLRWLRNPILRKKSKEGKGDDFSRRFFEFIDMKYVHPTLKKVLMEEHGLREELATERATMYQVKITKEGLVNAFKVSKEIMTKYDTETGEEVPRYQRTFNPDTGEIDNDGKPEHVEDRLFEPSVWRVVMHSTAKEPMGMTAHSTSSKLVVYTDSHHGIW